ncbi:MAG: RNase H family protein [Planctomycetota bacterium]
MSSTAPHFLLLTRASSSNDRYPVGQWSFVLERFGDTRRTEVVDEEPGVQGERLELLAVVRGLEALEQPSRVTLITASNYVGRGMRSGLKLWVENDFKWKRFGELTPVKNSDLWKRIARALTYHTVECRVWQFQPSSRPGRRMSLPSLIHPDTTNNDDGFPSDFADFGNEFSRPEADIHSQTDHDSMVGQHAARAGIVYRHYAARRRNVVDVAVPAGNLNSENPEGNTKPAKRRLQTGTGNWSSITSRVSARINPAGHGKPNHQPEPAYA